MPILVTGATGTLGRHIVDQLLDRGLRVRALTRDPAMANLPAEVETVAGDLTAADTLHSAFEGVSAVHLLGAVGYDHAPLTTGEQIAAIAMDAGVRRITVLAPDSDQDLMKAVIATDLEWTRVWPIDFMSNTLGWAEAIRTTGTVREPYGDRRTASVDPADAASAIATILADGGHHGAGYVLTGPRALTPGQKVETIAAALGTPLDFVELTDDQARAQWAAEGWPDEGIEFMLDMWASVPAEVATVTSAVEDTTGRQPRDLTEWVTAHAAAFQRQSR